MKRRQYVTIALAPDAGRLCNSCGQPLAGSAVFTVQRDALDPVTREPLAWAGWPQGMLFDQLARDGWRFTTSFSLPGGGASVVFERDDPRAPEEIKP